MFTLAVFLLVLGLAFLIIELFIPGFGVFGILGIISTAISFFLTAVYVPFGLLIIAVELVSIIFLLWLIYKILARRQNTDGLILFNTSAPTHSKAVDFSNLVGKTAMTVSSLRPRGQIELNNQIFEVVAQGDYIPPKTKVRISKLENQTLYVEKVLTEN